MTHADQAGQAHRATVDERDAETPAVHTEVGVFLHHPQIAPERQLHAARDGGAADGGDHGFGQAQS